MNRVVILWSRIITLHCFNMNFIKNSANIFNNFACWWKTALWFQKIQLIALYIIRNVYLYILYVTISLDREEATERPLNFFGASEPCNHYPNEFTQFLHVFQNYYLYECSQSYGGVVHKFYFPLLLENELFHVNRALGGMRYNFPKSGWNLVNIFEILITSVVRNFIIVCFSTDSAAYCYVIVLLEGRWRKLEWLFPSSCPQ